MKWMIGGAGTLAALLLLWWLVPRGEGEAPPETPAAVTTSGPAEIDLSPEQIKALALRFVAAVAAKTMPVATLPAMIVPPPNARVAVTAQLPGIVTRVFVVEGDAVRAGQALATISSRDMVTLSAELARANARLGVARASARRIGLLAKEGIVAPARADEADAALREAQVDSDEQARLISMTHGTGHGRAAGGDYTLTAPISGRISAMTIATGKAVDPAAAPFVIDGAGELRAQAQLPERLVGSVQPGMHVAAGAGLEGTVLAVGTALDPQTRSTMVTARLPASDTLRAGQALMLSVMGPAPAGAVRVPVAAVAQLGGAATVFVATAKGVVARPVTLAQGGTGAQGEVVILSGLQPGERVAVSAVSELKGLAGK